MVYRRSQAEDGPRRSLLSGNDFTNLDAFKTRLAKMYDDREVPEAERSVVAPDFTQEQLDGRIAIFRARFEEPYVLHSIH